MVSVQVNSINRETMSFYFPGSQFKNNKTFLSHLDLGCEELKSKSQKQAEGKCKYKAHLW